MIGPLNNHETYNMLFQFFQIDFEITNIAYILLNKKNTEMAYNQKMHRVAGFKKKIY